MNPTRTTARLAALMLAALMLAGCGGGGGEPTVSQGAHDMLQHELDDALAELMKEREAKQAAETARQTAEAEVGRLNTLIGSESDAANASGTLYAQLKAAQDEVAMLTARIGTAADPQSLEGRLAAANARVTSLTAELEGTKSALATIQQTLQTTQTERDTAQQQAEQAQQQAQQAQQDAQQQIEEAQRQADVGVRVTAMIEELTGDTVDDANSPTVVMGVSHQQGASRIFTRPLDLPREGSAPSVPGGWSSMSYSGPRGTVGTDTVYLYTNIQAPSSKAFWKEHGEGVTSLTGLVSGFTETATVTSFGNGRSLYQTTDNPPVAENRDNGSRSGTYDGYSGTFTCATACNITAAADGALTFVGDWTFTASLTARRNSQLYEQDTEFLYFGIWAFEPTSASGTPDFQWARGGDATNIANFGLLTGTATFTGGAVGKYALAKVEGRAARPARIGTFTATAAFTANFDTNLISGRITGFKEGGSDLGADWNIFLGATASTAATLAATGASANAVANAGAIDGDPAAVSWNVTLHGSDNADMSAADDYTAAKYPRADVAGVAGWFSAAAGTNAALAGAFGAACTTGTMCAR